MITNKFFYIYLDRNNVISQDLNLPVIKQLLPSDLLITLNEDYVNDNENDPVYPDDYALTQIIDYYYNDESDIELVELHNNINLIEQWDNNSYIAKYIDNYDRVNQIATFVCSQTGSPKLYANSFKFNFEMSSFLQQYYDSIEYDFGTVNTEGEKTLGSLYPSNLTLPYGFNRLSKFTVDFNLENWNEKEINFNGTYNINNLLTDQNKNGVSKEYKENGVTKYSSIKVNVSGTTMSSNKFRTIQQNNTYSLGTLYNPGINDPPLSNIVGWTKDTEIEVRVYPDMETTTIDIENPNGLNIQNYNAVNQTNYNGFTSVRPKLESNDVDSNNNPVYKVTSNGNYSISNGYCGLNNLVVDVPIPVIQLQISKFRLYYYNNCPNSMYVYNCWNPIIGATLYNGQFQVVSSRPNMYTYYSNFYLGNLSNNSIYAGMDRIVSVTNHTFNLDSLPYNKTGNIYCINLSGQNSDVAYWIVYFFDDNNYFTVYNSFNHYYSTTSYDSYDQITSRSILPNYQIINS